MLQFIKGIKTANATLPLQSSEHYRRSFQTSASSPLPSQQMLQINKKKTPKCSHYCFSSPTERFLWNSAAPMDRAVIGWLGNAEVVNRGLWLVRNRPVPPLPVCAAVMLGWDVKYAAVYKPVRVHVYNTCFYRWWSVDEWLMKQISARRKLGVVLLFRQL